MYKFNLEESFRKGWELTKKHWAVLVLAFLITLALSLAIGLVTGLFSVIFESVPELGTGVYLFMQLISIIVSLWTTYNLYHMMIKLNDGKTVKATDVIHFSNEMLPKFGNYILGNLLLVLVILLGFIAFIIPGIYFSVRFMFVPYLLIDKNMGVMDAFKKSSDMTRGEIWHLIGFSLLSFGIIIVGLIALLVGVIPAAILISLTTVVIYRKLESHVHSSTKHAQIKEAA